MISESAFSIGFLCRLARGQCKYLCFFNANILTDTSLGVCECVCCFPAAPDAFVCVPKPKKYANKSKETREENRKRKDNRTRGPWANFVGGKVNAF